MSNGISLVGWNALPSESSSKTMFEAVKEQLRVEEHQPSAGPLGSRRCLPTVPVGMREGRGPEHSD